jgi:hypothetical protein
LDNLGIIKKNHVGPGRQSHGPDGAQTALTVLIQWMLLPCYAHGFPAAISPPSVSPSHRPPSTASGSYIGHRPPPWSLLSSSSARHPHCAAISTTIEPAHSTTPPPLNSPSPPQAPRCRPPPPDAAPAAVSLRPAAHCRGAHPFGEDLPIPTPQTGAPRAEPP